MEASFWHQRWKTNRIGFHEQAVNPLLVAHVESLELMPQSRVFVPLCGKTPAIAWLLSQGHHVVGAELSEQAIIQLFADLEVSPEVTDLGVLKQYSAANLDIFVGDIFEITGQTLGNVDAIFDRAALVALPQEMRNRYTRHLIEITSAASQLLITFDYDQSLMDGPPFSITSEEVNRHYQDNYTITQLENVDLPGGFKGLDVKETAWLLASKDG